jgi:hypothetical protein
MVDDKLFTPGKLANDKLFAHMANDDMYATWWMTNCSPQVISRPTNCSPRIDTVNNAEGVR